MREMRLDHCRGLERNWEVGSGAEVVLHNPNEYHSPRNARVSKGTAL